MDVTVNDNIYDITIKQDTKYGDYQILIETESDDGYAENTITLNLRNKDFKMLKAIFLTD